MAHLRLRDVQPPGLELGRRSVAHSGTAALRPSSIRVINGRWRDTLTPEDCARYERVAVEQLGEACARWLATGERRDRSAEAYELLALDPPRTSNAPA